MDIRATHGSLTEIQCDALIVNLFEGVTAPGGGTGAVDRALGGALSELIADEGFEGKLGHTAVLRTCAAIPAKRVVLVGLGPREGFGVLQIMRASAAAARSCRETHARNVTSILHGAGIGGLPVYDCAKATALGAILGVYEYSRLKTKAKPNPIERFEIVELADEKLPEIERGVRFAEVLGDAICTARDLAHDPSNLLTPAHLAEVAEQIASDCGMDCLILGRKEIDDAGLGLVAAVSRGSEVEPRFIQLTYRAPSARKHIALIGKGVTFDTGGYSLKTPGSMYGMKDDMSGAANVLVAMRAIGRLKPDVNVTVIAPAVENAIGSRAIHPGDVFTAYDGRSVEIANTDAEGRLILADSVAYAAKLGVDEIVDLATLTGACVNALGRKNSAILGNDQALVDRLIDAGRSCGEKLWQMPLDADYRDQLDSDVADIKNIASVREGDVILSSLFIESFTGGVPWAHIDLSAALITEDEPLSRRGSTGVGTGTVIEYVCGSIAA